MDNKDIDRLNALIVPELQALGIRINDLHSLVAQDIEGNICHDDIHLSTLGAKRCAEQVANLIRDCLEE